MKADATLSTGLGPRAVEGYLRDQLLSTGWVLKEHGGDGPIAWSTWDVQDQPGGPWDGLLVVIRLPGGETSALFRLYRAVPKPTPTPTPVPIPEDPPGAVRAGSTPPCSHLPGPSLPVALKSPAFLNEHARGCHAISIKSTLQPHGNVFFPAKDGDTTTLKRMQLTIKRPLGFPSVLGQRIPEELHGFLGVQRDIQGDHSHMPAP